MKDGREIYYSQDHQTSLVRRKRGIWRGLDPEVPARLLLCSLLSHAKGNEEKKRRDDRQVPERTQIRELTTNTEGGIQSEVRGTKSEASSCSGEGTASVEHQGY